MRTRSLRMADRININPRRHAVLQEIASWPCSTPEEIAEGVGMGRALVKFHVRVLTAAGVVGTCGRGGLSIRTNPSELGEGENPA